MRPLALLLLLASSCARPDASPSGDACDPLACTTPPPASCTDAATLTTYAGPGACAAGTCSYAATLRSCPFGCEAAACASDPCLGVSCDAPPADECIDEYAAMIYLSPGTCADGGCAYDSYYRACDEGCFDGVCLPVTCGGQSCSGLPAPRCLDATTLERPATPICLGGQCEYPVTTTPCVFGCEGDHCAVPSCDALAGLTSDDQLALLKSNSTCIATFVSLLETDPVPYLDAFYAAVADAAVTNALFSVVYDELRFERFRFVASVVDDLLANLPAAVASCTAAYRCADWQTWILDGGLYVGRMFRCPATTGRTAGELLAIVPYGDYACTETVAAALAPVASSTLVSGLLAIVSDAPLAWSRRNGERVLGRFAEQPAGQAAHDLVVVSRAVDVQATLLARLEGDSNDDVLNDAIYILDAFFNPYFPMQPALAGISADTARRSETRFRAIAAIARLIYWVSGVLAESDVGFIIGALGSDDSWVRAEAAYICEALRPEQRSASIEARLVAALLAAYEAETVLTAKVYQARALDALEGTSLAAALRADYEAAHLGNTASGSGVVVRSGLLAGELSALVTLVERERAAFAALMGAPFDAPVAGDANATVTLVVFATMQEYRDYMGAFVGFAAYAGGLYVEGSGVLYTFERTAAESIFTLEELVQHEYGHALQARYVYPGVWGDAGYFDEPRGWADEGLAEVLAGMQLDTGGGYALPLRQAHLATLCAQPYRQLASLLAARDGYERAGTFDYANGWSFAHYLATESQSAQHALYLSWRDRTYAYADFASIAGVASIDSMNSSWHTAMAGWCAAAAGPQGPADTRRRERPSSSARAGWALRVRELPPRATQPSWQP